MTSENTSVLDDSMVSWISDVTNAERVHAERRRGGGSRAGYAVDVDHPDGHRSALWLRMDTGVGPQSKSVYTLRREAAVYRALADRGLRLARVVAVHPTRDAFLMNRITGDARFSAISSSTRRGILAKRFIEELAAVHALDPNTLELPELGPVRSVEAHVREEISIWRDQYQTQPLRDPLLELALWWLDKNVPADQGQGVVLVQGDTGPGNFMFEQHEVVAITDWEMAHFGDFHDDLAWIYARDVQERFTDLPERMRDYERVSGSRIDVERLRYFLVLAETRCSIGIRNGLLAHDSRGETANHLVFLTLHKRVLAEALAERLGVEPVVSDTGTVDAGPTEVTWMFDVALDDLRTTVAPALDDAFSLGRAKGLARIIKYLREVDRIGPLMEAEELSDLNELLGNVNNVQDGRHRLSERIAEQSVDPVKAMAYCLRQQARETQLCRPSMGVLADRHHAPLP